MIKNLVELANRLDKIGLFKEADFVDKIIKKSELTGYIGSISDLGSAGLNLIKGDDEAAFISLLVAGMAPNYKKHGYGKKDLEKYINDLLKVAKQNNVQDKLNLNLIKNDKTNLPISDIDNKFKELGIGPNEVMNGEYSKEYIINVVLSVLIDSGYGKGEADEAERQYNVNFEDRGYSEKASEAGSDLEEDLDTDTDGEYFGSIYDTDIDEVDAGESW